MVRACLALLLVAGCHAGANTFCMDADGNFQCAYPCGSSTWTKFQCADHNATWTCEYTYAAVCNYDTTCEAHGLVCNATSMSASMECPKGTGVAPWDGYCGCGCDAGACIEHIFGAPPLDPSRPFSNATLREFVLSKCILADGPEHNKHT